MRSAESAWALEFVQNPLTPRKARDAALQIVLDFDEILQDTDAPVPLKSDERDETYRSDHGTTIRLSAFLSKRVPDRTTFHRQLAVRYALADPDFVIHLIDTRKEPPEEFDVEQFKVPLLPVLNAVQDACIDN